MKIVFLVGCIRFFFIHEDVNLYPLSTSAPWLEQSFARATTNRQTTTTTTKKQGVTEHYFGRTDEKAERKELRKMELLGGKNSLARKRKINVNKDRLWATV